MAGTFLQRSRHATVWYFRRRVPDDLRSVVGHPYLVKSLGTEARKEAVVRARVFCTQSDDLFNLLRAMSEKELAELAAAVREAEKHERKSCVEKLVIQAKEKIRRKIESDEHEQELLDQHIGFLREKRVERLQTQNDTLQATLDKALSLPQVPPSQPFGMRFEDAIDDYLSKIDVSVATKKTYRPRLNGAMKFFGADTDIRYIEKSRITAYANHVKATSDNYNGKRLEISQLLTLVNWMRDTYEWGTDISSRGLMPKRETPDSDERDSFTFEQLRVLFDNAKRYKQTCPEKYWATLAMTFFGCRITELAQINLDHDLIQHEDGFWYISITETVEEDESGGRINMQSVKNIASWRLLPIHPALEKHGFVEFLLAQKAKGDDRRPFESKWRPILLEDETVTTEGGSKAKPRLHWGRAAITWGSQELGRLRKKAAISDPEGKLGYFHSMRHSFEQLLIDATVPFDLREASKGHQYGGKDTERYAKLKKNPKALLEQAFIPGLVKLSELLDEA